MNKSSIGDVRHVLVKDMDDVSLRLLPNFYSPFQCSSFQLGQLGFQGYEKLNVIQSIVFEQAYKTKENLLICAPTGAGSLMQSLSCYSIDI